MFAATLATALLPLAYWVHDLDGVILRINEQLAVRWYGVAYVGGFLLAWLLMKIYHKHGRSPLGAEQRADLLTAIIIGVLVGGRLGYTLLYDLPETLRDPLRIFYVWEGGMASHGGMVGVALAVAWYARKHKISFLALGDIIATLAPPGIFLGRIANFVNGELWGRVAQVKHAVIFPEAQQMPYFQADACTVVSEQLGGILVNPRHPSQLYEAALEGLFLGVYIQMRFWLTSPAKRKPGQLAGEFLLVYALVRIFGEQFREPDYGISPIFGLTRGVFYSLFLMVAGLWLILRPAKHLGSSRSAN